MAEPRDAGSRFDRLVEYGALVAIALSPTQIGVPLLKLGRATVSLTAADIVLWALAALLVGRWLASGRRQSIVWPPLHIWLLAALAALSACAWLSPALPKKAVLASAKELVQYLGTFVAVPVVFLNAFTSPAARRRAVWTLIAVTAPVCVLGLVQALAEHWAVPGREALFVTRTRELDPTPHDPGNVIGLFGSRTVYSVYLLLVLPVAFALALANRRLAAMVPLLCLFLVGAATVCAPGILLGLVVAMVALGIALGTDPASRARQVQIAAVFVAAAVIFGPFRQAKADLRLTYPRPVPATEMAATPPSPVAPAGSGTEQEAPPDEQIPWLPGEGPESQASPAPATASAGEQPAPPDEQIPWLPGEGPESQAGPAPATASAGEQPAPPDEQIPWLPGEGPEGAEVVATPEPAPAPRPAESAGPTVNVPTIHNRYSEWGSAMQMVGSTQFPVGSVGLGPGHYQDEIGGSLGGLPKHGKLEPDFQGAYLVLLLELGLAGLTALVFLLGRTILLARTCVAACRVPFERALAAGVLAAMSGLLVANLYGSPFVKGPSVTLMLLASLIVTLGKSVQREE